MTGVSFSQAIELFIESRRAARYSENTLNDYRNTYKRFRQFLDDDPPLARITITTITRFMASTMDVSDKTALNYHTGLSSLWNWAVKNGHYDRNIVRLVDPPVPEKRVIIPFTRNEVSILLEAAGEGRMHIRDVAIVLTLVDTGIRASEICDLRIRDLNTIERRLHVVFGKGDKERELKVCERTLEAILTYLVGQRIVNPHNLKKRNLPLFVTKMNTKMNRNTIRLLTERLESRSGVNNVHAHRFRHTFAVTYLRNGGNVYTLQELLGHATLDMVKRYLEIAQIDIDNDHDRASPVKIWML